MPNALGYAFGCLFVITCTQWLQHQIPIAEVDVKWEEIAGSTLDPLSATIQMAKDIFRIKLLYSFGVWRLDADTHPRLLSFLNHETNKKNV
jgi:hypothetical protein